jgi:hypothetical protein
VKQTSLESIDALKFDEEAREWDNKEVTRIA